MIAQQRYMFFIDGENLVFRFQDMIKEGCVPNPGINHLPDTYVWANNVTVPSIKETLIIRANYYTSVYGDDNKLQKVTNELKALLSVQPSVGGTSVLPSMQEEAAEKMDEVLVPIEVSATLKRVKELSPVYVRSVHPE